MLLGVLIDLRVHIEAVNRMTEPTMNTKRNALDNVGADSRENARRPERVTPHPRREAALMMTLPTDKEKASAWLALGGGLQNNSQK